jgi:hypothetical protein
MDYKISLLWTGMILLSITISSCAATNLDTPNTPGTTVPVQTQSDHSSTISKDTNAYAPIISKSGTYTTTGTLPVPTNIVTATQSAPGSIKTVFLIVMENHDWSSIQGNPSAPYINKTLLPQASYALNYHNPPGNHPSLPNYLWLEAGTNFGIHNDGSPYENHQSTTQHLVTLLNNTGISWKAYEENISGKECPLNGNDLYAPRHNPMVYFNDVTNNNDLQSPHCISHERPFSELAGDLQKNTVARYNFITPNVCDDMHNLLGCATMDPVKNGDTWLSKEIPMIMASKAYMDGGVIIITWDEAAHDDAPIGLIVLSPLAKGNGYTNNIHYTHSSTLRTIQEIFRVKPLLGDAANATDLSDLFKTFP